MTPDVSFAPVFTTMLTICHLHVFLVMMWVWLRHCLVAVLMQVRGELSMMLIVYTHPSNISRSRDWWMCIHYEHHAKPHYPRWINLYPHPQVWVCWGRGTGSPGKPQGYPCKSLVLALDPMREDPWHSREMPDPYRGVLVPMPPGQICPDGARPTQIFKILSGWMDLGFFWAQIVQNPDWLTRCPKNARAVIVLLNRLLGKQ